MQVEERPYRVSINAYRKFLKSNLWKDMRDMLEGRSILATANLRREKDQVEIYRLQGRAEEIDFLLSLPENIIGDMEYEQSSAKPIDEGEQDGSGERDTESGLDGIDGID